jgi:hypothetical protein
LPLEEGDHVGEPAVETTKRRQHEGAAKNSFAQVPKCISHALETTTVVEDGEISLDERAELGIKIQCAGFLVADELILQSAPDGVCRRQGGLCDLDEIGSNSAIEPGGDGAIHAPLMGIGGDLWRNVVENMVGELVLAEGVEEEGLPPIVVGRKIVEDDQHKRLDVEHSHGMCMESSDGSLGLGSDVVGQGGVG